MTIKILHIFEKSDTFEKLVEQNNFIISKLNLIMGQNDKVMAAIKELDAATTEVANDLQALRDQVASGNVSDESLAALDESIARLKVLGADPENPVPAE